MVFAKDLISISKLSLVISFKSVCSPSVSPDFPCQFSQQMASGENRLLWSRSTGRANHEHAGFLGLSFFSVEL